MERAFEQQCTTQWRERIIVLPHQSYENYLRLCAAADVLLDTFPFGGGNSHYEALATYTPVVTLRTRQMRGRITSTLYHRMGMGKPIDGVVARSVVEYVRMATTLGLDRTANAKARAKIAERVGVLYEDTRGIKELGQWLANVSQPST